LFGG